MIALDLNLEGAEGPEGVAGRKRVVGSVEGRPSRGRGTAGTGVLEGATVVAVAGNGAQSATQTVTCRPASAPNSASVHVASPSSAWGTPASPLPEPAPAHFLPLLFFLFSLSFCLESPFPRSPVAGSISAFESSPDPFDHVSHTVLAHTRNYSVSWLTR